MSEGQILWRNCQNFTILQDTLYQCFMPKGENEDPTTLCSAKGTLDCHQDVGYQGCDHTLSLLQECFWWPGMAKQMTQNIRACTCCLQFEGGLP